jgi:filamentous hemagglutinin family protein
LRRRLLAGCALASAALLPGLAQAQLTADSSGIQVSAGGAPPIIGQSGRTTDITLGAPRTILTWSSFNLAADQAVVYRFQDRSWIVLNRVGGSALIDGQIEALVGAQRGAGNVWFSAPGGVIFGSNARVNVGGLLATPATVASSSFLNPGNTTFDFDGAGAARVEARAGAELRTNGGALALIAGDVVTQSAATITGAGPATVLYGAANAFTVRFSEQAGDLDLLDFVVPAGGGTLSAAPLSLQGQTVGSNVILAVVNRTEVASAVISAQGVIAAQSAAADRGDVVLSAGVNIVNRQPGAVRLNSTTETSANFGVVSAQRDLLGAFSQPTTLQAGQLGAGRDLGVIAAGVDSGLVSAGRVLAMDAGRGITLRAGASAGSAASLRTSGGLVVGGGSGSISAIGRLQIDAGSVQAGRLNSGRSVVVNASGAGGVTVGSALADDDILITTTNAAGGISLGSAEITGTRGDEAPAGRILSLIARGAQADVAFGAASGSRLAGATGVIVAAGRDATLNVAGALTLTSGSAGRAFTIRAVDLDLAGPLTAATLRVESLQGGLTLGGTSRSGAPVAAAPAEGLLISDAEFQRLLIADTAGFYALAPGNLIVNDLTVDPARIPHLTFGAGAAYDVVVAGALTPSVSGGVLTIGESAADALFRPGRILVTGAIGASMGSPATGYSGVRAFDEVSLNARRDVILGAARFADLVGAALPDQIDIARNQPSGVAPADSERDRIFLTAGVLSVSASDRIVQQNTGTLARPNGLYLTNRAATPAEVVLTVTPAEVVDVFGAYLDRNGALRSGLSAVGSSDVQVDGSATRTVRFNGLGIAGGGGSGGGVVAAIEANAQQTSQITAAAAAAVEDSGLGDGDGGSEATPVAGVPVPPPVLTVAQPNADDIVLDPVVAGAGSDEIWRSKRRQRK